MKPGLCALLLVVLVYPSPLVAQTTEGDAVQHMSTNESAPEINEMIIESRRSRRIDFPGDDSFDMNTREQERTTGFATRILRVLASQNRIQLYGEPTGELDAFLRPPDNESSEYDLFETAKSIYNDATSVERNRYRLTVDPLTLRWVVRINLNQIVSE